MFNLAEPVVSVVSIFFPQREPLLTQEFSREAIQAIIAENEVLVAKCAATREALASAYFSPEVTTPEERPSSGFIGKRAVVEQYSGRPLVKFFTE